MLIYHGSLVSVEKPAIIKYEKGKTNDFGVGFYTTTSYEQAKKWVEIKILQQKNTIDHGFISTYEVPDTILQEKNLNTLVFNKANKDWLDFVVKNRKGSDFETEYDIVYGPVANDRVYTTINLYELGLINVETTLLQLKTYKLADQLLFHTEKALNKLKDIKSEIIQ